MDRAHFITQLSHFISKNPMFFAGRATNINEALIFTICQLRKKFCLNPLSFDDMPMEHLIRSEKLRDQLALTDYYLVKTADLSFQTTAGWLNDFSKSSQPDSLTHEPQDMLSLYFDVISGRGQEAPIYLAYRQTINNNLRTYFSEHPNELSDEFQRFLLAIYHTEQSVPLDTPSVNGLTLKRVQSQKKLQEPIHHQPPSLLEVIKSHSITRTLSYAAMSLGALIIAPLALWQWAFSRSPVHLTVDKGQLHSTVADDAHYTHTASPTFSLAYELVCGSAPGFSHLKPTDTEITQRSIYRAR